MMNKTVKRCGSLLTMVSGLVGSFAYGVADFQAVEGPIMVRRRANNQTDLREVVNSIVRSPVDFSVLTYDDMVRYIVSAIAAAEAVTVARNLQATRTQVTDNNWNYLRGALAEIRTRLENLRQRADGDAALSRYLSLTFSPADQQSIDNNDGAPVFSMYAKLVRKINDLSDDNLNRLFGEQEAD